MYHPDALQRLTIAGSVISRQPPVSLLRNWPDLQTASPTLVTEQVRDGRPGHFSPPLGTLGDLGLIYLSVYCLNWLREDQQIPWRSPDFSLELYAELAKALLGLHYSWISSSA